VVPCGAVVVVVDVVVVGLVEVVVVEPVAPVVVVDGGPVVVVEVLEADGLVDVVPKTEVVGVVGCGGDVVGGGTVVVTGTTDWVTVTV
jgi:hypothetical protein